MSLLVGLIDVVNRLMFHQFEVVISSSKGNPDFLRELIRHTKMLLKLGKLNFSEIMLGRLLHPDHYLPAQPVSTVTNGNPQSNDANQQPAQIPEIDLSKIPEAIRKQVQGLARGYTSLKQQIDLLNIFRFQKHVEDNILQEKANPNVQYSNKVRDILSKTSRLGIVTDNLQNLSVIIYMSIRDFGFGLTVESILWVVT